MVKKEVLKKRLEKIDISLKKIKRYKDVTLDEFLEDDIIQDIVEYNLFIAINMMVDIAIHIVVDNNLGSPDTMAEAFEILQKEKYICKEDTVTYKNMVAFRNILSHEYVNIDKQMVYYIMSKKTSDFERFILFVNDNFI